jgi:thiamine transport system substrate-binding protein
MLPAFATSGALDPVFEALPKPAKDLSIAPDEIAANRKAWIEEWLAAMAK